MPLTAVCEFAANSHLRICRNPSELVSSQRKENSCCSSFSSLLWQLLVRKAGDRYRNFVYPCLLHSLSAMSTVLSAEDYSFLAHVLIYKNLKVLVDALASSETEQRH